MLDRVVMGPGAFRLSLAFLVLFSHVSRFATGRLGVMLFFLLSGFWVLYIWQRRFGLDRLARFYGSRYFRIAPLYFLTLVLAFVFVYDRGLQLENFTILGIASHRSNDLTGVSWSLDIELQYYLLMPLIALIVTHAHASLVMLGAIGVACISWTFGRPAGLVVVTDYIPAFIVGALIHQTGYSPSRRVAIWSLAAFLGVLAVGWVTPFGRAMLDKHIADPMDEDVFAMLLMVPLIPYIARSIRLPSSKLDRHLGNLSYPLYLAHWSTITYIGKATVLQRVAGVLASMVIALAAYVIVDRPVDSLRHRIFEKGRASKRSGTSAQGSEQLA